MTDHVCPHESDESIHPRRNFLQQAVCAAAGAAFALTGAVASADEVAKTDEIVLKLKEHDALKKVGGAEKLETDAGKVIVARVDENTFAACLAVCPHKQGPIEYDADSKQFFCPLHRSRFAADGKLLKGPATRGLKAYASETEAVVSLK